MGLKDRYLRAKTKLLTDQSICAENRDTWRQFFDYEERKLLHINGLSEHDAGCYKTLYDYVIRLRTVNNWFENKPWAHLTRDDIKRVYEGVRDGTIANRRGTPHKDARSYFNKILKGKPFRIAGRSELARDVIEFPAKQLVNTSFLDEDGFRRLIQVVTKLPHLLLFWLAWDFGENISSLLELRKSDFRRRFNTELQTHDYLLTYRKEILKRARLARTNPSLYDETARLLDLHLSKLNDDERLFTFGHRQALKVLARASSVSGVRTLPFGGPVRWKDFRSGMACHLLRAGWSKEAVNVRLGHKPHSMVLDPYLSHLVIDHDKEKQKLHRSALSSTKQELAQAQISGKHHAEENRRLREEVQQIRGDLEELHGLVRELIERRRPVQELEAV